MEKNKITLDINLFPDEIKSYLNSADIFDFSFNTRAKTYFIDRGDGYYLKTAPKNTLEHEAVMMDYFHGKNMTARLCSYISENDNDYMLMERVKGESCLDEKYLKEPKKLAVVVGKSLRKLHDINHEGCPKKNITSDMLKKAHEKYKNNNYDAWFLDYGGFENPQDGYNFLCENAYKLTDDVNLHGDACLPNIMLDDFKFSGFIDFEGGGIGDRHFDLIWAIWSLQHNLQSQDYKEKFLDAYGRDKFDNDRYRLCIALQAFTYTD